MSTNGHDTELERLLAEREERDAAIHQYSRDHGFEPMAPLTDSGNAERFAKEHGEDVRHCRSLNRWLVYDGTRFAIDDTSEVEWRSKATVRRLYQAASDVDDEGVRKATAAWARKSEAAPRRDAMLHLARAERVIAVRAEDLDRDPFLLNLVNGTLDLRTGRLSQHSRGDLITKLAPVVHDPEAQCPTWIGFLTRILDRDAELLWFLQRWVGYALTGDPSAEAMLVAIGKGSNGKSTFIGTLQEMFGDYARSVNPELLLVSKNEGGANRASPDLMTLRGTRLAVMAETGEGRTLSAAMVKRVCSTDKIAARGVYADSCEFAPTHKLFFMTNHKPRVRSADEGTWRRIFVVPFTITIPEAEQDKDLRQKLRAELPGILAWALRGCLDWQKRGGGRVGLSAPPQVLSATKTYRDEEDVVAPFLTDACKLSTTSLIQKGALYRAYEAYAARNHEDPLPMRTFNNRVQELAGVASDRIHGGVRVWRGIGLGDAGDAGDARELFSNKSSHART